jgi:hypothetical protein
MRRLGLGFGLSVAIAGAMLACGAARLPAPSYVGQPTEALQQVQFPPPPARVEFVPQAPNESAVWLDGEWTWQGRRWAWKQGRWVAPPANAKYSPWTATRDKLGALYVAEGQWRDADGGALPDPKALAVGRTRGGPVTGPEGEAVPSAPNVPAATPQGKPGAAGAAGRGLETRPETPSGATPTGTEPKTGPIIDSSAPPPDADIPDADIPDAVLSDAMPLVEPVGASSRGLN